MVNMMSRDKAKEKIEDKIWDKIQRGYKSRNCSTHHEKGGHQPKMMRVAQ
jgi:hypothetical protein